MESKRSFNISLTLPDGSTQLEHVYACTKFHAVDTLYARMMHEQPDRTKYRPVIKRR